MSVEGTQSTVSEFAGPYVADMLGKSWALSNAPYQAYGGPLTAGITDAQQSAFTGVANLAMPETGTQYNPGTLSYTGWNPSQAQNYMNPYLQNALNPMMEEARRQSNISRMQDAGRLTQAGAYGGSRQAIMESEQNRNLMDKQNQMLTQGYNSAYDKALTGFQNDQSRNLQTQLGQENINQAGARFGLENLAKEMDIYGEQARLGGVERAANQEAIAADYAQFQQQRDYPYEQLQFMQSMLNGLPIAAQDNTNSDPNTLSSILGGSGGIVKILQDLGF